jgi:hypothetical protein
MLPRADEGTQEVEYFQVFQYTIRVASSSRLTKRLSFYLREQDRTYARSSADARSVSMLRAVSEIGFSEASFSYALLRSASRTFDLKASES